jgi:hypothetical protein
MAATPSLTGNLLAGETRALSADIALKAGKTHARRLDDISEPIKLPLAEGQSRADCPPERRGVSARIHKERTCSNLGPNINLTEI